MKKTVERIDNSCETKYPVLFVHGLGVRDDSRFYNYWGKIPRELEARGCKVYYSGQDAWGAIEGNAAMIQKRMCEIMEKDGVEKFNIIAHSKGGLEARHLIASMGMDKCAASLATISSPHHGMQTVDFIFAFPKPLLKIVAFFVNIVNKARGDKSPDFYNSLKEVTTKSAEAFNAATPDKPGILYQSYSAKMKNSFSDLFYVFTHPIIKFFDGDNDGLVSVEAAKWGDWLGVLESDCRRGMSHSDIVGWRCGIKGCDIREVYIKLVQDLKACGL